MRTFLKWVLRSFLLVVVLAGIAFVHVWYFKPHKIEWFYERVFAEFALENPEMLSGLRMLPPWLDWYSDDLDDASPASEARYAEMLRDDLAMLRRYDRDALPIEERINYDVLEYFLATAVAGDEFKYHNYPLNQLFGLQNGFPEFMVRDHQVNSVGDADNYLARLDKVPVKFGQILESLRLREAKGILPPTFVVEKVLTEMRAFVAVPPTQNILYQSFERKLSSETLTGVDASQRALFLDSARVAIRDKVYPAYGALIRYYAGLLPKTQGNRGVWALPDGDAFYAWTVKHHTTTDMTPDDVHALGLSEVARIGAEMDANLRAEGETDGSIGERMRRVSARPDQQYPRGTPEAAILADDQAIVDQIEAGLDDYFGVRPKAGVKVERIPAYREQTAPIAYYTPPPLDGSQPGVFSANLRNLEDIERLNMRTLAYHEAIPGHHFQIAIKQELTGVPTFRRLVPFSAFSEGWALYAERLAWEAGFQQERLSNLGRLQAEVFRAVRLVVDTGLHHKRWTREQAIDYVREHTGLPEGDIVAEVERYLVTPGQALSYKVGMNKILDLRARAKSALGDQFDIRSFHDVILTGGAMPLTLLEQRVDAWIAKQQKR